MRVLLKVTEKAYDNDYEVIEIECAGWDDDITCVKNDDGTYDKYKVNPKTGLYMVDMHSEYLYIEGVSKENCVKIVEELLINGYADLRSFGMFKWSYEFEDEEDDSGMCSENKAKEDFLSYPTSLDSSKVTHATVASKIKSAIACVFE